jgi:hypothetical protein
MGRAVTWALGAALATVLAGVLAPALASEATVTAITKTSPSPSLEDTPDIPPTHGFGLVTTNDKPPPLADYTISNLIRLATPWPIEERVAQAEAPAPITPNLPIAKPKPKPKPKPELRPTAPKPQKQLSWLTADWWRGLTWLRIR